MATYTLRQEFHLNQFGFGGVPDRVFAVPQARWYLQPFSWILYRFAVATYAIVWMCVIISFWGDPPHYARQADTKAKWFIYVSNWSYTVLCLYLLTSFIVTLVFHIKTSCKVSSKTRATAPESIELSAVGGKTTNDNQNNGFQSYDAIHDDKLQSNGNKEDTKPADATEPVQNHTSLSWYFKVMWFLQNVAFTAALFVVLLFWGVDFDPAVTNVTVFNVHIHGVNLVIVLLDKFLIASPYRLFHFIYPCSISLMYYLFTILYYLCGGMNEYPPDDINGNTYVYKGTLDWGRNVTTSAVLMTVVVTIVVPIIHLLFFGLYHIRRNTRRCCKCCDGVAQESQ